MVDIGGHLDPAHTVRTLLLCCLECSLPASLPSFVCTLGGSLERVATGLGTTPGMPTSAIPLSVHKPYKPCRPAPNG